MGKLNIESRFAGLIPFSRADVPSIVPVETDCYPPGQDQPVRVRGVVHFPNSGYGVVHDETGRQVGDIFSGEINKARMRVVRQKRRFGRLVSQTIRHS